MVRIIVGTLVDISRGHWRPEQIVDILAARTRRAAGHRAPANGLCLESIQYGAAEEADHQQARPALPDGMQV